MRNTKPLAVAAGVTVLALAACGGGTAEEDTSASDEASSAANAIDPEREAPAAPIDGAVEGGTVTALSYFDAGSMDSTEVFRTETVSILGGLVTRSLTQYVYDPLSGSMVLVVISPRTSVRRMRTSRSGRSRSATGSGSRTARR